MNPTTARLADARTDALAQTERAREDRSQTDTRADHQASLYRGQTTFAHAHRAHAKLLSNKLRASKMRAKLAQARKTRTTRRGKFSAPRKTHAPVLKHVALVRTPVHRVGGLRVSRDGGRGGQQGQQGQQQGQGQGQQGRQGQQHRRERSWRRSSLQASSSVDQANWLDTTMTHPAAIADACCVALLSLRHRLATNPHARIDTALHRLAREATAARFANDTLDAGSIESIKTRLIEHAERHASTSQRMQSFNLLAGLHLLMMERPLRRSNAARSDSTLDALERRRPDASHA